MVIYRGYYLWWLGWSRLQYFYFPIYIHFLYSAAYSSYDDGLITYDKAQGTIILLKIKYLFGLCKNI